MTSGDLKTSSANGRSEYFSVGPGVRVVPESPPSRSGPMQVAAPEFPDRILSDSTEIRPTGHRLPIANSAIRCAAPRARRPPRAGARGASGLGRERPHAYAAPSASPGSRYTPVRRASREYRDEYGIELKKTKGERDPEIAPSDRTRSAARLHATRAPAPRDRVSTHIRHEGARLVRTTAASAIRLELGGRLRWENHSQILQTCPRTQLK